jgi:hypothetical protein
MRSPHSAARIPAERAPAFGVIRVRLDAALQCVAQIRRWNPAPAQNIKVITFTVAVAPSGVR